MDVRYSTNPRDVKRYTTEELRGEFLIENLFVPGKISMTYSHVDRMLVGGGCPVEGDLAIVAGKEFGADYLLERREMGVLNVGGSGKVKVDGKIYDLPPKTALYIGMGARDISFASDNPSSPSKFYFLSCPAHASYPTTLVPIEKAVKDKLGAKSTCNERVINKFLHPDVLKTCQLSMGMTILEEGSIWNTMPTHTHERRMEVYLYLEMAQDGVVFHYMGTPQETRHIVVKNEEAVISPSWSIHSGCGTASYAFIWGMCGENQTFSDMDHIKNTDLK